jgi:hypothetical protein
MTHYRAKPEDDAVLIVLRAVRDGQFGKSALNEVIDLWVAGQIGRTDSIPGAVEEIAAWLQHVDRLDEIPGARIGLPERNVLWDAAEAIRQRFGAVAQ